MWPQDKETLNQNQTTCRPTISWLTTTQAAKYIGMTPNALRIMVHRNQIPFYKLRGRLRFKISELDGLLGEKK